MSILQAAVQIQGLKTLAINHFGADSLPLTQKERTGVAGNDPEEWKRTVLMNDERQLFLPPTYFFGTIKEGGKYVKKGKSSCMYDIAATLQILEDQIFLKNADEVLILPNEPQVIDAYSISADKLPTSYIERITCKNPTTKARNIRYRVAAKPGWQCQFTILWDSVIINRVQMRQSLDNAGALVGIGDGRKSIGYGRFVVKSFDVVE